MGKSRFGGDKYKPHQLGPEPASPHVAPLDTEAAPSAVPASEAPPPAAVPTPDPGEPPASQARPVQAQRRPATESIPDVKVPYSSRITYAADLQLKALAKRSDRHQTDLLAEALNLLFAKHGLDDVA
jgi:hypothetical protein